MPLCTHKGCGKEFDEAQNAEGSCTYHSGGPVFHEGLKSWSCCNDVNKPVMEFDQFMAIPGCTTGKHTTAAPKPAAKAAPAKDDAAAPTSVDKGVETYGSTPASSAPPSQPATLPPSKAPSPPRDEPEEEDDPSLPVPEGAKCKHLGCNAVWKGADVSRGDGPEAPVFHEGSKGYLCCKPRVLEFDQFLKIPGCKEGKHLFVGSKKEAGAEELVDCRLDHYQTPMQVHVSAYAKNADKTKSTVTFGQQTVTLDLYLPSSKHVHKTLTLYGPIVPDQCTFRILTSKVDITLAKPAAASWPLLELPPPGTELPPGYALTFGVSGRTGSIGGKDVVLSVEEAAKQQR